MEKIPQKKTSNHESIHQNVSSKYSKEKKCLQRLNVCDEARQTDVELFMDLEDSLKICGYSLQLNT